MLHARPPLPIKTSLYKVRIHIDYSTPKMQAIKTMQGQPEERQELLPGPNTLAVCTWADGSTYESDVANLMLASRASAKVLPRKQAKGKAKAKGKEGKRQSYGQRQS